MLQILVHKLLDVVDSFTKPLERVVGTGSNGRVKRSAVLTDSSLLPNGEVPMLTPLEVLIPLETRLFTGEDCTVEAALEPLLAGDEDSEVEPDPALLLTGDTAAAA
jgi:hypothetical protein